MGWAVNFAGVAVAGPLEDGLAAYDRGDFAVAATILGPLAEGGDGTAQATLGLMYSHGSGVEKDDAKAAELLREAAAQDIPVGEAGLGRL